MFISTDVLLNVSKPLISFDEKLMVLKSDLFFDRDKLQEYIDRNINDELVFGNLSISLLIDTNELAIKHPNESFKMNICKMKERLLFDHERYTRQRYNVVSSIILFIRDQKQRLKLLNDAGIIITDKEKICIFGHYVLKMLFLICAVDADIDFIGDIESVIGDHIIAVDQYSDDQIHTDLLNTKKNLNHLFHDITNRIMKIESQLMKACNNMPLLKGTYHIIKANRGSIKGFHNVWTVVTNVAKTYKSLTEILISLEDKVSQLFI